MTVHLIKREKLFSITVLTVRTMWPWPFRWLTREKKYFSEEGVLWFDTTSYTRPGYFIESALEDLNRTVSIKERYPNI